MRLIYWLTTALVVLLAAAFAVANRQDVSVSLWPLFEPLDIPLYLVTALTLLAGLFVGLLIAWIWSWRARRAAREHARRVERLERDLADARQRLKPGAPVVIPHR